MIGQKPEFRTFTEEQREHYDELNSSAKAAFSQAVDAINQIVKGDLFLLHYQTFADYLRGEHGITEKTFGDWKRARYSLDMAYEDGAILKNKFAARALRETAEASRKTVVRMAQQSAGDRPLNARDIRNAANALMEAMDNVAAGDDVAELPALAEQSDREANQRTSMAIDKRQGWSSVTMWRFGDELPGELEPGRVYEFKWRVIDDATS